MINLGNKRFKKLHKGNELVTRIYKGDELIYRDFEALYSFKFTIDTRFYDQRSASTSQTKTFKMAGLRPVTVDWGDGTRDDWGNINSFSTSVVSPQHTYTDHGVYQVTLIPRCVENGEPIRGWMNEFAFDYNSRCPWKVTSFDKPIPPRACRLGDLGSSGNIIRTSAVPKLLANCGHLNSIPDGFYDNVRFSPEEGNVLASATNMFNGMFTSTGCFTSFDPLSVARGIMQGIVDSIDFSSCTTFDNMFQFCFSGYPKVLNIPADVFPEFDTSHGTNFSNMFYSTFWVGRVGEYTAPQYVVIPEGLFDFLDTSNGTNFSGMFQQTFGHNYFLADNNPVFSIPAKLFSHVDTRNATTTRYMFKQTFSGYRNRATSGGIPAGLFDTIATPNVTDVVGMYSNTFYDTATSLPVYDVPSGLFDSLDISHCTDITELFRQTFDAQGGKNQGSTDHNSVPDDIFAHLDTSNVVTFSAAFYNPFRGGGFKTGIPAGFMSNIDTRNGKNFNRAFCGLFSYADAPSIPSNVFAFVDTSNGTNFTGIFEDTFYNACSNSTTASIPSGVFDSIDTSNGTYFGSMFKNTFSFFCNNVTPSIPAALFDSLDMTNATSTSEMFSGTFQRAYRNGTLNPTISTFTIPATLFSKVKAAGNTASMFQETFATFCRAAYALIIPSTLFSTIDTTGITNVSNMFNGTFSDNIVTEIPQGLFGGLDLSSATNLKYVFYNTFNIGTSINASSPQYTHPLDTVINDPFDGMTYLGWCTAANAHQRVGYFYALDDYMVTTRGFVDQSVGSASTILQHFNYDPTSRTSAFRNRTGLTDYATIGNNWK